MDNILVKLEIGSDINLINYIKGFHPLRVIEGENSFAFIEYYHRMMDILKQLEKSSIIITKYSMTTYEIETVQDIMRNIEEIELLELAR